MQVILQGSLRHFPAGELLAFLCGRGGSGTLDVEATGRRARLFFMNGRLVWAESSQKTDNPAEAAIDVFNWDGGSFTVLDSAVLPEGIAPVGLDIQQLLDEARRRTESLGRYRQDDILRVVDDPALHQQVSLTSAEFKVLFRIGNGRAFGELQRDVGMTDAEILPLLRKLMNEGLITVSRDTSPVAVEPDTAVHQAAPRKRTLVGSLTPDTNPDRNYPLLDAEYTLGRSPENAIMLGDGSVSSKHARVVRTSEGFLIEDLKSRNGTFVNGEKVTEPRALADGDVIRLGKVLLTFNQASESQPKSETQPELRLG